MINVSFTEGADQRYAIPVMRVADELAATIEQLSPGAVIARLDDGALLVDAMSDPRGISQVVGAALSRRTYKQGAGRVNGHPRRTGVRSLADDPRDITVLGVEQSNSSALIGGSLIAKLIRRVEPGVNPDVELPRYLAATAFAQVPDVAATLDVDVPGEAEQATVMVVHDAIDHESDLWVRVLDELSLAIDKHVLYADEVEISDSTTAALADLVGRRTAELHRALAGQEIEGGGAPRRRSMASEGRNLAPEQFTLMWQRQILQSVRNATRATERELRRHRRSRDLREGDDELIGRFVEGAGDLVARFDWLVGTKLDAARIRIHGDLHLGQILWTGHDVVFIDFEGEPGLPMGQRTIKRSPLADVAGLVRSIDYAGRVAVHTATERGRIGDADLDAVERWRVGWTATTQQQLLETYRTAITGSGLVPDDPDATDRLLQVYMATKCLYEVRYELANRPEWVSWPLSAVVEMLDAPLE
jgi:maltose alpha-D-glucosyltransferase/alpha-amylase